MKKKALYLLATAAAVSMWLLGVFICRHYYTIGNISWFKFPFWQSNPIVEFVYYKDELLYFGLFEHAVDIDVSYNNLLIVYSLSKDEVLYDTKQQCYVSEKQSFNYEPAAADKGHHLFADWGVKDYYNVINPNSAEEWRERALEY